MYCIRNLGIIMSVGAVVSLLCYGSVPVITKKFDERKVYLICGLLPMFLARIVVLPIPGFDPPTYISSNSSSPNETYYSGDKFDYFGMRNIDCDEGEDTEEPGCPFDWCQYTPAITEAQFYIHYAIAAVSFPYCMAICQAMFRSVPYSLQQFNMA